MVSVVRRDDRKPSNRVVEREQPFCTVAGRERYASGLMELLHTLNPWVFSMNFSVASHYIVPSSLKYNACKSLSGQKHFVGLFVQQAACKEGQTVFYEFFSVLSLRRMYKTGGVKHWYSLVISGSFSTQTKRAVFSSGYTTLHRTAEIIGGNIRKEEHEEQARVEMDGFRRDLQEEGNERGRVIWNVQSAGALEMFMAQ